MNKRAWLACLVLTGLMALPAAARTCDPLHHGAKADGVTKDTKAIQAAIDDCAARGGGIVVFAKGTYVSAPIVLKSNITLDLADGAVLLGSPDHGDYPQTTVFNAPGQQSLISSVNAHDIAITGKGTIDGNGAGWWRDAKGQRPSGVMGEIVFRPRLLVFDHSRHIRITGVTVQNSPSWQIIPYYCDDVAIRDVKVLAPADSPNHQDRILPPATSPSPTAFSCMATACPSAASWQAGHRTSAPSAFISRAPIKASASNPTGTAAMT
jgi:polygalacturonase